jgi:hypothetical protein
MACRLILSEANVSHLPLPTERRAQMRIRRWEFAVGCLGVAFAALFLFGNTSGLGYALLAADALWIITRIEIVERHDRPGRYTTLRGRLGVMKLVLLLGIYSAAIWGLYIIRGDLPSRARAGVIGDFAIAGLCFMLLGELNRSGDATLNWFKGAQAERANGAKLDGLKERGWLVLHGYKRDRGGDIDHVVCGPTGVYAIETKSYGFRSGDIRQTAINAWWLREKLGIRWVTGILCVAEDRQPEPKGRIWIVGQDHLLDFIEQQRNTGIEPARAQEILSSG